MSLTNGLFKPFQLFLYTLKKRYLYIWKYTRMGLLHEVLHLNFVQVVNYSVNDLTHLVLISIYLPTHFMNTCEPAQFVTHSHCGRRHGFNQSQRVLGRRWSIFAILARNWCRSAYQFRSTSLLIWYLQVRRRWSMLSQNITCNKRVRHVTIIEYVTCDFLLKDRQLTLQPWHR